MTTRVHKKTEALLLELNDGQKTALSDLEKKTPESNIKRGATALLLIAERTEQILAKRASARSKGRVLGMKEILDRSGYSSRDTLHELVRRYNPNDPKSILVRKSRVRGATPGMLDALRAAYTQGNLKNYASAAIWLNNLYKVKISSATYYRWLECVTVHRQRPASKSRGYGELARLLTGELPRGISKWTQQGRSKASASS